MRALLLPSFALLCLLALSACGNGNDGLQLKKKTSSSVLAVSTNASSREPLNTYGSCKLLTVRGGSSPSFANQLFTGAQVCRGVSRPSLVLLKVNAYFPANSRFCLVPLADAAFPETCFYVDGQAELSLSTSAYSALVLVAESDLSAYKAFLNQQNNNMPPSGFALLN